MGKVASNAYEELMQALNDGERVEAIVFGGWGGSDHEELGYGEPDPPPVPFDKRGVVLTLEEAKPLMQSWQFIGGYGSPDCYAVHIWTNTRVFWVTQYDGSTGLDSAPRNPTPHIPDMPGG